MWWVVFCCLSRWGVGGVGWGVGVWVGVWVGGCVWVVVWCVLCVLGGLLLVVIVVDVWGWVLLFESCV